MSAEISEAIRFKSPGDLNDVLSSGYRDFTRGDIVDIPLIYQKIDRISTAQVISGGPNPLSVAFLLVERGVDEMDEREALEKDRSLYSLEMLLRAFDGIPGYDGLVGLTNQGDSFASHPRSVELIREVLSFQRLARITAKEKSIGLFYEHLAGVIDPGVDSPAQGFSNPDAGYFQLLIADFLHNTGRNLLLKYIKDSNILSPGPKRFDRDYGVIEQFRERERNKWSVIAVSDLIAAEVWESLLQKGSVPSGKVRSVESAIGRYRQRVAQVERQRDINTSEARDKLNPFVALLG